MHFLFILLMLIFFKYQRIEIVSYLNHPHKQLNKVKEIRACWSLLQLHANCSQSRQHIVPSVACKPVRVSYQPFRVPCKSSSVSYKNRLVLVFCTNSNTLQSLYIVSRCQEQKCIFPGPGVWCYGRDVDKVCSSYYKNISIKSSSL